MIFGILIVATVCVYAMFAHDLRGARDRVSGRSETIETSFGTMEYAVMGEGQPMLMVHGAAGGFDQGLDMTGAMAVRGYRLIAPSRFGYLRSTMPNSPTNAMQADAYAQLLDRLGIDKVVVVCISAGEWSSLEFAIRHPERTRALVLLVPANYLPAGTSIRGGELARAMFNSDFVAWAALKLIPIIPGGMSRMMLGTDAAVVRGAEPSEKARVRQVLVNLLPVSQRIAGMNFDIRTAAGHETYAIEKITCPVLTISDEDDRFDTASRAKFIAASVPGGRAIIFPTGGHALVGHFADAQRAIALFLQTLQKRTATVSDTNSNVLMTGFQSRDLASVFGSGANVTEVLKSTW